MRKNLLRVLLLSATFLPFSEGFAADVDMEWSVVQPAYRNSIPAEFLDTFREIEADVFAAKKDSKNLLASAAICREAAERISGIISSGDFQGTLIHFSAFPIMNKYTDSAISLYETLMGRPMQMSRVNFDQLIDICTYFQAAGKQDMANDFVDAFNECQGESNVNRRLFY
ncbi:MAG: hypothetical protein NTX76_00295 [Alphaproteobacteria bacterium]|nr:hypothetical protein [Alphaproteobacteria bacterium]